MSKCLKYVRIEAYASREDSLAREPGVAMVCEACTKEEFLEIVRGLEHDGWVWIRYFKANGREVKAPLACALKWLVLTMLPSGAVVSQVEKAAA